MKSRKKKMNREKTKKAMRNRGNTVPTVEVEVKYLRALRRTVWLHIDPDTAELYWIDAYASDPYGDYPDLPKKEKKEVGREYFTRFSGSDLWVWLGDLPKATADVLWKRIAKDHKYYCIYCGENGGSGKLD